MLYEVTHRSPFISLSSLFVSLLSLYLSLSLCFSVILTSLSKQQQGFYKPNLDSPL